MPEFQVFHPVAPVPQQTLNSLAAWQVFPRELLDLLYRWGTGLIGQDGYLRIIDPGYYAQFLPDWFTDTQGAVPFMATGMGDLFVWQPGPEPGGMIRHVLYRIGDIRNIRPQFDTFFSFLEMDFYLDDLLLRGQYPQGIQRLGIPSLNEALFYAPFLVLGGPEDPSHLDCGDLAVSISIFTQMMGKASIIPGRPAAG